MTIITKNTTKQQNHGLIHGNVFYDSNFGNQSTVYKN